MREVRENQAGFTVIETIVAAIILAILCVGIFSVFEAVIRLNRINSIRLQAHSLLQKEVELYRALKFVPINPDPALAGRLETLTKTNVISQDGSRFDIYVTIDNNPYVSGVQDSAAVPESNCRFKEIRIRAQPLDIQVNLLGNVGTTVAFQRVRLID